VRHAVFAPPPRSRLIQTQLFVAERDERVDGRRAHSRGRALAVNPAIASTATAAT